MAVFKADKSSHYQQLSMANLRTLAARLGSANQTIFKHHGGRSIQEIVSRAEVKYRQAFVASRGASPIWKYVHDLTVGGLRLLDRAETQAASMSHSSVLEL